MQVFWKKKHKIVPNLIKIVPFLMKQAVIMSPSRSSKFPQLNHHIWMKELMTPSLEYNNKLHHKEP